MATEIGQKNFYELLGLERTATKEQIKEAYRELARIYHPDSHFFDEIIPGAGPTTDEVQVFKIITEAYNTLSNEERRSEYDKELPQDLPEWEGEGKDHWHAENRVARAQKAETAAQPKPFTWGQFGRIEPINESAFDDENVSGVRAVSEMIRSRRGIVAKLKWLFFGR